MYKCEMMCIVEYSQYSSHVQFYFLEINVLTIVLSLIKYSSATASSLIWVLYAWLTSLRSLVPIICLLKIMTIKHTWSSQAGSTIC